MQCENASNHFSDLISGDLEKPLAVSLENHIEACESCRETVAGLRRAWESLDSMPLVDPPEFFHENLMARVGAEAQDRAAHRISWDWRAIFRPRSLAYAATALVVVLAGFEVVQSERASLGPLGMITSLLRPGAEGPALQVKRAEWQPAGGVGQLVLHIQPKISISGAIHFTLQRDEALAAVEARQDNILAADRETEIVAPMDRAAVPEAVTVYLVSRNRAGTLVMTPEAIPLAVR